MPDCDAMSRLRNLARRGRTALRVLTGSDVVIEDAHERARVWDIISNECEQVTLRRGEVVWTARTSDSVARDLFLSGHYQQREITALDAWLRGRGVTSGNVIDVGANIGTTTVPFARLGWNVVSVEPVPDALELLRRNVANNVPGGRVQVVEAAVSDIAEQVEMALDGDLGHSEVLGADTPGFGDAVTQTRRVRALPLDDVLREAALAPSDVALVWCDTQGHEGKVLAGGTTLWRAGVPCFAEVWPRGMRAHGGIDEFVDLAAKWFTECIPRETMLASTDPAPCGIDHVARLIEELDNREPGPYGRYTDVLLIP